MNGTGKLDRIKINKPRDLVGEVGNRPPGSGLEILKRVNTR